MNRTQISEDMLASISHHIHGNHPVRPLDDEDRANPLMFCGRVRIVHFPRGFETFNVAVYGDGLTQDDCVESALEFLTDAHGDAVAETDYDDAYASRSYEIPESLVLPPLDPDKTTNPDTPPIVVDDHGNDLYAEWIDHTHVRLRLADFVGGKPVPSRWAAWHIGQLSPEFVARIVDAIGKP